MDNVKMTKKNIIQLESYRDLVCVEKSHISDLITNSFFELYSSKEQFLENVDSYNEMSDKLKLIQYEIDVAMLQSNVDINGEKMSLRQADDQCESLCNEIDLYAHLKVKLNQEEARKKVPLLNFDEVTKLLMDSERRLYSLREKISKAKSKVYVEVDMESLIL
jgi:hypothetical protein